jgi:hypothetical protein
MTALSDPDFWNFAKTALLDPDFWNKPHRSGGVGLAIGAAVGFGVSFYFFPVRKYEFYSGLLLSALIWGPCALLGIIIGQLVGLWIGR